MECTALRASALAILMLLVTAVTAHAAPPESVDYLRDVKPIFEKRCYACHGAFRQQGELRLDTAKFALQGGESGPIIVPGDSEQSRLIEAVTGDPDIWRMPPAEEGEQVPEEEVAILRAWIDSGAVAPETEQPQSDPYEHWAFQTPHRPPLGAADNPSWVRNPIDIFIAREHARHGLVAQPEAPKHILLRRVYLDLIGVPPTPEQLRAFEADESPIAYERVVDQLLASPQYGHRWGRHWMDVWRYSDWYGYGQEIRNSQRHIWRWRDWIVESLNADRGYDQMIVEMLAADELRPDDPDALRATGFLARQWFKFNRNVWLDTAIEHTGKAFLGLTFNCARCHDHKYDPIAQTEYFQFRAIFEPYEVRTDTVPGQPDIMKDGLPRVYDAHLNAPTYLFERGDEKRARTDEPLSAAVPALFRSLQLAPEPVALPPKAYYPALRPHVAEHLLAESNAQVTAAEQALQQARAGRDAAASVLARFESGGSSSSEAGLAERTLHDHFDAANPELWQVGEGDWHYRDGRLEQRQAGPTERRLVSVDDHPQDFQVELRMRITGGDMWQSCGLSFDRRDDDNSTGVYLSAHNGGKIQIYHSRGGKSEYPAGGTKAFPVQLNTDYTLRVEVREALVNVWVNDQLQLVYSLPYPRERGKLALWAFDATTEFDEVQVGPLPEEWQLASELPAEGAAVPVRTAEAARQQLEAAEKQLHIAERKQELATAQHRSLVARLAAEQARYAAPPSDNASELASEAARAEKEAALCQVELEMAELEQQLEAARAGDMSKVEELEKKLADATNRRSAAVSACEAPGEQYSPVGTVYPSTSSGRRLALARWITHPENPLTARVAINQMWMRHFGSPLVSTVFDFGMNGQPPTHPELLDWLAMEFIDSGWSMKHIHRLMVTSATYRMQSWSGPDAAENQQRDPDNRFLWRTNPRRMEAEIVRDSVLAVGGGLDLSVGGPELAHTLGETTRRRSIYYQHAAERQMEFLSMFDIASVNECYRRSESVVPQQALAMANSTTVQREARWLARELSRTVGVEAADAEHQFVEAAFVRVLGRSATAEEMQLCTKFLERQRQMFNDPSRLTKFTAGADPGLAPSEDPALRARENLTLVLLNHTDFVTIR